jgi:hypothetical protein
MRLNKTTLRIRNKYNIKGSFYTEIYIRLKFFYNMPLSKLGGIFMLRLIVAFLNLCSFGFIFITFLNKPKLKVMILCNFSHWTLTDWLITYCDRWLIFFDALIRTFTLGRVYSSLSPAFHGKVILPRIERDFPHQ